MESVTKSGLLFVSFCFVLLILSTYFLINHFFEKQIQFRAFEECLVVVSGTDANWVTRKDTIIYCKEQTR